jgi:hypothetical protein
MSFNNQASAVGAASTDETVEDCKLRCELLDKCVAFMYDNLTKQCRLSIYRWPNSTPDAKTHAQRFCYRDFDGTFLYFFLLCFALVRILHIKNRST